MLAPGERFAIVLADPPYIPSRDTVRHPGDPRLAIDGGPDGLAVARQCLSAIGGHLAEGGFAILQLRDLDQVGELVDDARARGLVVTGQRTCADRGALALLERSNPDGDRSKGR